MPTVKVDVDGNPIGGQTVTVDADGNPIDSRLAGAPGVMQPARPGDVERMMPPPEPSFLGSISEGMGNFVEGSVKGTGSTLLGLGKLFHHIPGMDYIAPDRTGVFSDAGDPDVNRALETHGFMQGAGKVGEQVAEAFIPGGNVNRGIAMAKGLPTLARVGVAAGLEGLAGGGVAAVQTGGDPTAVALGAGLGAVFRGVGTMKAAATEAKLAAQKGLIEAADKFGVDLQQVEQVHSLWNRALNTIARKFPTGAPRMQEFDLVRNKQVAKAAAEKLMDLSKAMPARDAGEFIQNNLKQVKSTEMRAYGDLLDQILGEAKQSRIRVSMKGEAMQRADELMREATRSRSASPELAAKTEKYVNILKDFGSGRDAKTLPNAVSFDTAAATLKDLNEIIYSADELTPHRAQLLQLKQAFEKDIEQGFEDRGRGDLAKLFRGGRDHLASTYRLFEEPVIESMLKNGTPESIVDSLINKGGETRATLLRRALHTQNMNEVRTAVWQRMIGEQGGAMGPEGVFEGRKLANTWDKLSPAARDAIFGDPALVKNIDQFVKLADATAIGRSAEKPMAQRLLPTLMGGAQLAGGGYFGVKAAKALWRDDKGDFWINTGAGTAALIAPALLSKWLTRPAAVKAATKALTTDAATSAGKSIAAKLAEELGIQLRGATVKTEITEPGQGKRVKSNPEEESKKFVKEHPELYAVPPPPGAKPKLKTLDQNTAERFYEQSGGDPEKARALAKASGYMVQ